MEMYATKEEDFFQIERRPQKTMFGVFDGHGGKFVARKCSEHCWVDEEDIEERFWKLDETLGPQSLSSGTTASIMVINHVDGDDFSVTLAWVGDSQIMEIDMTASAANVTYMTSAHNCTNAAEIDRIQHQWRARELFATMDPDLAQSQFGLLTRRAFAYEKKLDATYDRIFAARAKSKPSLLERAPSHLGPRRSDKGEPGALALHARWFQLPGKSVVHGASTCVTRSIGDWDSSRALIPHPEIVRRIVKRGPNLCKDQNSPHHTDTSYACRRRTAIHSCIRRPLGDTESQSYCQTCLHART